MLAQGADLNLAVMSETDRIHKLSSLLNGA